MTFKYKKIKYIGFDNLDNENMYVFVEIINKKLNLSVTDNPNIIFYTEFIEGVPTNLINYTKIFYTGENTIPPKDADLSFSFGNTSYKNFQLPNFARFKYFFDFKETKSPIYKNTGEKFCNFIYYNNRPKDRIEFCKKLTRYKSIDCPGKVLNNINSTTPRHSSSWVNDKLNFLKDYKFTIAFENEISNNYVTEKIFHAFLCGSIPIYWGAENVGDFFNPKCFINVNDFDSFDNAIEYIKKVDNDDKLYSSYFENFPIHEDSKLNNITEENIINFLKKITKEKTL